MSILIPCFMDLHIHIGRSKEGKPVKITASPAMTLSSIIQEAAFAKGIQVLGIIDGACPTVLKDLKGLVEDGVLTPVKAGGFLYQDQVLIIAGYELEVSGPKGGVAHFGLFFPTLQELEAFTIWLKEVVKNPNLSSQMARCTAFDMQQVVESLNGICMINHAFTPHTGMYGSCVSHANEMVDLSKITALELGLSANQEMADRLSELSNTTFVTNSDAHSLAKIGREYNQVELDEFSFAGVKRCLLRLGSGRVIRNFGLHPELGKYHTAFCQICEQPLRDNQKICPNCGKKSVTNGVSQRIEEISDQTSTPPNHRPPYQVQVPLQFVPGIGPKTIRRLLDRFGTEMAILHQATLDELKEVVSLSLAEAILAAREGRFLIKTGGGGTYGKIGLV